MKNNQEKHLALRICDEVVGDIPISEVFSNLISHGLQKKVSFSDQDFLSYFSEYDSMQPFYEGKYPELNKYFLSPSCAKIVGDRIGIELSPLQDGYTAEVRDLFFAPIIIGLWSKNKQILKPYKELSDALWATETEKIFMDCVKHLPYNTFFVDLEDVEFLEPFKGALVNISPRVDDEGNEFFSFDFLMFIPNGKNIRAYTAYSFYTALAFGDDGTFPVEFDDRGADSTVCPFEMKGGRPRRLIEHTVQFIFGLINYLGTAQADVEENPVTKKTYRKPVGIPKNKFSELQQWDLGVRFSNTFVSHDAAGAKGSKGPDAGAKGFKEPEEEHDEEATVTPGVRYFQKKCPHFRCGHWHHFWIGHRDSPDRKLIVKWLPPIFVGNGQASAVIHHVK